MIISSMKIVILTCEHVINEEISDGQTHAKPVSCVLYNTLFKVVSKCKKEKKKIISQFLFYKSYLQFYLYVGGMLIVRW